MASDAMKAGDGCAVCPALRDDRAGWVLCDGPFSGPRLVCPDCAPAFWGIRPPPIPSEFFDVKADPFT